jgi:hypothetical protein
MIQLLRAHAGDYRSEYTRSPAEAGRTPLLRRSADCQATLAGTLRLPGLLRRERTYRGPTWRDLGKALSCRMRRASGQAESGHRRQRRSLASPTSTSARPRPPGQSRRAESAVGIRVHRSTGRSARSSAGPAWRLGRQPSAIFRARRRRVPGGCRCGRCAGQSPRSGGTEPSAA